MARPAEFDRNEVLDKAMEVFWRTGFTATSVTDLVKATNLKPGSLYGAFNSKRGLFVEVIDNYANRSLHRINQCMNEAESPLQGIYGFFMRMSREIECDQIGKGCLMVNTLLELATEDEEIRVQVTGYLARIEARLREALESAKTAGEIAADADCYSLAKLLMTGIWGLRVLSTTRPEPGIYSNLMSHLLTTIPCTNTKMSLN